ncbi:hypothetical protein HPB51_008758 [Rhipicephalus microplus]|uniref:Uncharacterized protein n=1 Tax=Rhipicephalus microplus TaxID=6941 RepID=A0A9J6EFM9_RHIMP|nr:hypothetical protein HPB51_008758 [Rhipicephalus microplus]
MELSGIPMSAEIPADRGYNTEYLHGVEGDLVDHERLQCIESSVLVVLAVRSRNAVTLRFADPATHQNTRAVCTMVQEENHPQLSGPPDSTATQTYAQAASGAPRPVPTPSRKQVSACSVLPSTDSNASPSTPAVAISAEAVPPLRNDPRDAIITSLQLTVRVVGELLPSESPLKVICLQADGLQKTSSHHS